MFSRHASDKAPTEFFRQACAVRYSGIDTARPEKREELATLLAGPVKIHPLQMLSAWPA